MPDDVWCAGSKAPILLEPSAPSAQHKHFPEPEAVQQAQTPLPAPPQIVGPKSNKSAAQKLRDRLLGALLSGRICSGCTFRACLRPCAASHPSRSQRSGTRRSTFGAGRTRLVCACPHQGHTRGAFAGEPIGALPPGPPPCRSFTSGAEACCAGKKAKSEEPTEEEPSAKRPREAGLPNGQAEAHANGSAAQPADGVSAHQAGASNGEAAQAFWQARPKTLRCWAGCAGLMSTARWCSNTTGCQRPVCAPAYTACADECSCAGEVVGALQ